MTLDDIFGVLPYGFSDFDNVKNNLIDCRAKSRLPENARTVISVLFPYYLGEEFYESANVSRYAVSEDYHIVTSELLNAAAEKLRERFPGSVFEVFVDNSPLPEVRCAVNAGLGCLGRNSLFINERYGSWVFLGEIVTDRHFPPTGTTPALCEGCDACVSACPMGAITDHGVDRENCLSFLSQKKGDLPEQILAKMRETGCAWGCDVCQKVCPRNAHAAVTPIARFFETASPHVEEDVSVEGRAFAWRGKAVIERNLRAMKK